MIAVPSREAVVDSPPYYRIGSYTVPKDLKNKLILETLATFTLQDYKNQYGDVLCTNIYYSPVAEELEKELGETMLEAVNETDPSVDTFSSFIEFNLHGRQNRNNRGVHIDINVHTRLLVFGSIPSARLGTHILTGEDAHGLLTSSEFISDDEILIEDIVDPKTELVLPPYDDRDITVTQAPNDTLIEFYNVPHAGAYIPENCIRWVYSFS